MPSGRTRLDARAAVRALSIVVLLAIATAIHAADPDLVVLQSGNQMTGKIRELARGELTFRIEGANPHSRAGIVDIDWLNVAGLRSPRQFDIELKSGELVAGTIDFSTPAMLEIATDTGGRSIATTDIVRVRSHAMTFRDRTTGKVDLGFDFLSSDDEIDWTFNATATHRTLSYRTQVDLHSLVRRHSGETTQQRNHLDVETRRLLPERRFIVGLFGGEQDYELDLDLRLLLGAAMGRTVLQTQRTEFALYGGVALSHEQYRSASDRDGNIIELLGALRWEWFEVAGNVDLALKLKTYVAPDTGRVRFDLDTSLRHRIARNYFWSLNLYETYNSDPPADRENSDLGVSITLGRSF